MTRSALILAACGAIAVAAPATAQYLDSYLQTEQAHLVSELSQDRSPRHARPSAAKRQAAWSRHKKEYRQRMRHDGMASADRWLDEMARTGR